MSSDIANIISIFSKFLDPKVTKEDKFKSIEEIKKLPVHSYKFISKNYAKILKDLLKISKIEEISKLNRENPFENLKIFGTTKDPLEVTELQEEFDRKVTAIKAENPELEKAIKKAIFISSIITNMVDQGEILQKSAQKVIVIGLDNAGKTAILVDKLNIGINILTIQNNIFYKLIY